MPSAALKKKAAEQEQRVLIGPDDTGDAESPAYECQSFREQLPDVVMMREVGGGTKTMRAAGTKYLPQHPMEQEAKYKARIAIAIAFNALGRTVGGLVGMIFRRDPVLSRDMDEGIRAATEDIDLKGHKLPIFLHDASIDALLDGHVWIHVEAPPEGAAQTRKQERQQGLRPYWIKVLKSQAPNFDYVMRGGRPVITLFVYDEGGTERAGAFGQRQLKRKRVLREVVGDDGKPAVRGELWEWEEGDGKDKKSRWVQIDEYPVAASRVPIVFLPSKPTESAFESEPPLRDLAYEQAEHYRVRSDRQKSLTFSSLAVPYAFGKGMLDDDGAPAVAWGSDGMMLSNDPEATAGMIESHGYGLVATKDELADIASRMSALGLQMLVRTGSPQPGSSDVTATADIMKRAESDAALVLFADAIEGAANECLELHASYSTAKPNPGTVKVNRAFHKQLMTPEQAKVAHEMVGTDDLSQDTFWKMLKDGEILPEDFDLDKERALIEKQRAQRLAEQAALGLGPGGEEIEDTDGQGEPDRELSGATA